MGHNCDCCSAVSSLLLLPQHRWTWRHLVPPMPAGLAAGVAATAAGVAVAGAMAAAVVAEATAGLCPLLAAARCVCQCLHILLAERRVQTLH